MGTQNTVATLQKLHKTIEGVSSAPLKYAGSLNTVDLPFVLTLPKTGLSNAVTSRATLNRINRTYEIKLFYEPVSNNVTGESLDAILIMLDRFNEVYWSNKILADGYVEIQDWQDTGIIAADFGFNAGASLIYGQHFYRGFAFDLNIIEVKQ